MTKNNLHKQMSKFTIFNGKFIGEFETLYKKFNNPFLQTELEKNETTKKIIINYCERLKEQKKKKLSAIEIGCGFGKLAFDINKIGVKCYGTDISETAIKKAKLKYKKNIFYKSGIFNDKLYKKIKPDIFIMSEITWYILPDLKKFINYLKKNFKNKYLIHTLAIYPKGIQKYGNDYFTSLNGILNYFKLDFIEYGERWNSNDGRTFFIAKIK